MRKGVVPAEGVIGESALREAAATEFGTVRQLVAVAIRKASPNMGWLCAIYPDRAIVSDDNGRQYAYPYTIDDNNNVSVGAPVEVVTQHVPANAIPMREAAGEPNSDAAEAGRSASKGTAAGGAEKTNNGAALQGEVFIEAIADGDAKPTRYLVRVIRAGTSLNKVTYPAAVLREAAPLFNGVRVFVKSDDEHIKGGGKDFRQLVGRLTEAKFVAAKDGGEIQAVLDVLDSSDVAPKLREAVQRGMTDLFGLSIDASGNSKKSGKFREATKLTKVASVDLIIEPGAGGQFIRFAEAHSTTEEDTMLRSQMIKFIEARDAKRAATLADASDEDVLTAYREAVKADAGGGSDAGNSAGTGVTRDEVDERLRMIEARATARSTIAISNLPDAIKERLTTRFSEAVSFADADVATAIEEERKFLGRLVEGAQVRGLGEGIEMGEGRTEKVNKMLDDFFDVSKPLRSFRECYVEITGDTRVTGLMRNVDHGRLREAAGANFREAVSAATFGDILGDSITRAMIRQYGALEAYQDWRWCCDVVPVADFRTQERTRMGGYGNLPDVAENGDYTALTTPTDEAASYKIKKRGGIETLSIEAIANDDVGLIRRIPLALATAAGRTLYEFVHDFLADNPAIYDTKSLFHADHSNLGATALAAVSFAAARLAMKKQTELSSAKRLGITLRHLAIPSDLEETAFDLFVRDTNNDDTFVQSRKPKVHVVDYWTDANNWYATADNSQVPLIELGFYGGNEDPEIFIQDSPTQGSLFSNDQIKYKIRHMYSGAVRDWRGFYGAIVA